jgi:sec-independent protein translocase protein TatA
MGFPGTFELILILAVVVLIFGGRKLPEIGTALGNGIKNFRKNLQKKDEIDVTPQTKKDDEPKP